MNRPPKTHRVVCPGCEWVSEPLTHERATARLRALLEDSLHAGAHVATLDEADAEQATWAEQWQRAL